MWDWWHHMDWTWTGWGAPVHVQGRHHMDWWTGWHPPCTGFAYCVCLPFYGKLIIIIVIAASVPISSEAVTRPGSHSGTVLTLL